MKPNMMSSVVQTHKVNAVDVWLREVVEIGGRLRALL